ncbi:COX15/CtaA family protein [Candidatus Pelagibacter sp.]|nr:COX15/CtaA family protein [Candidatus Pelagibacter sp.]
MLIITMVGVGGLTRLTDSGLSITAWELFSGILPPLNFSDWNYYFSEYKKIPEYKNINFDMTLNEFKIIYYWEYFHRLLARMVGLFSLIPLIFFNIRFKKHKFYSNKYYIIFLLVCLQGFVGWYMVSSGLIENNDVSHFRLSLHLSIALLILSLIFWFILDILNITKFSLKIKSSILFPILALFIIQIIFGSFLAGLNGGLIYNTWPDMNGTFLPNDVDIKDYFTIEIFNNPSLVQLLHRTVAYVLLLYLLILNYYFYKYKLDMSLIYLLDLAILLQIILGILTLLSGVEIKYASLHQLGSIFVLTSYITILYKNTN